LYLPFNIGWIQRVGLVKKKISCIFKENYFHFKKQESGLWPLLQLYSTVREVGQVFRGLHEDPLPRGDEDFFQ